jgi:CubicO group peptidase (beta-lactamase class C family)
MLKTITALGLIAVMSLCTRNEKPPLKQQLAKIASGANFSGAVLVACNNQILVDTAFGFADEYKSIRNTTSTIFPIASITKLFVKHALFLLADQGKIKLSDTLSDYCQCTRFASLITIADLLHHTSGLPDIHNLMPEFVNPWQLNRAIAASDLFEKIDSCDSLLFAPGTRQAYSNSNYLVLAHLIEILSGVTLDVFLQENLFQPYQMSSTGLYAEHSHLAGHAQGFYVRNHEPVYLPDFNFRNFWGSGNSHSTTNDLYKYALKSQKEADAEWRGMLVQHSGYYLGYRSYFKTIPEIGLVIIILANNGDFMMPLFTDPVFDYIVSGLPKMEPTEVDKKRAGIYVAHRLGEEIQLMINSDGESLLVDETPLLKIDTNIFLMYNRDLTVVYFHDNGTRHSARVNDNGQILNFVKTE